jgi:hypothetical protein
MSVFFYQKGRHQLRHYRRKVYHVLAFVVGTMRVAIGHRGRE